MAPEFVSYEYETEATEELSFKQNKMDLATRLQKILDDAKANGQDMILLGNLNDFTEDEMKIIYEFKVKSF